MKRRVAVLAVLLLAWSAPHAEKVPKEDLDQLRALASSGKCDRVLTAINGLRPRHPDDPDLFVLEANCLLSENRIEERRFVPEAYQALRARVGEGLVPTSFQRALYETRVVYPPKVVERANELLDEAIRRAPFRRDLYIGRVFLHQITDEHDLVLEAADLAAVRVPDNKTNDALLTYVDSYLRRGEADRAVRLAELISRRFPQSAASFGALGRARLFSGDLEGARQAFALGTSADVTNVPLLEAAAEVEMLARSWSEAAVLLTDALARAPKSDKARYNIAWCKVRSEPLQAANHLQSLLRDSQGRGGVMHKTAVELQRNITGIEPPPPEEWLDLGRRLADGRLYPAALAAWDYALELDPGHRPTLVAMGDLYARLHLPEEARVIYERLATLPPSEDGDSASDVTARVARAYLLAGSYDRALESYLALDEPQTHALEIASIHTARGDFDEARRWLEAAAKNPDTAEEARRRLAGLPAREAARTRDSSEP